MTITRLLRGVLKSFAVLAVLGVLRIVALLGFLWLENRSEVTLPTPTGSFAVGRAIHDWTDSVALDPLAPVPGTKRELLVWIWYPSAAGQSVVMDDYLPAGLRPKASHGYVVVGFDAPYRTGRIVFPDGRIMGRTEQNNPETCVVADRAQIERCLSRVLTAWTGDIAFVLDRLARLNASDSSGFTGRLDMTRVGVFGHSLGGAVALQFCHEDSRCKAGIDIDGAPHGSVIQAGLRQPFMFLLSDHGDGSDPASIQIGADIQSIYDRIPPDRSLRAAIRGAFHFTFSDDGALLKSRIVRGVLRMLGKLGIDGRRQLAVTTYCVHTFFDMYLKGVGGSRLRILSPLYPEIQVLE